MLGHFKIVLGTILLTAASVSAQSYSLTNDWNGVTNPNGVWSYGDRGTGSFVSLGPGSNGQYGAQEIYKNTGTQSGYGIGVGQISLHDDEGTPDVLFTAPSTAVYNILVEIGGNTAYDNGGTGNRNVDDSHLLVNGNPVTGTYDSTDNLMIWNLSQPLAAGGTVDAYITENYGSGNTQTTFEATVPEPASLVLLMSAGTVALIRRRPSSK